MSDSPHEGLRNPDLPRYRPLSRRRRLLIFALAIATAVTVVSMLIDPPGRPEHPRDAQVRECPTGRGVHCVGGTAQVLLIAPQGGASAAASAP
ncbi:hypothetical protein CKO44_14910 [Rubrivivax gelatinosus]|uniref:hypothetical protein n=1 Tax=Rubrivivax gelatinosus TaxID=28068 RepID=UPI00190778A1|nr:hypothetical protein [Rubrivivax gelatinosus]MBK1614762.1 hypothetical protein [Rubrivivax gelatinosus]